MQLYFPGNSPHSHEAAWSPAEFETQLRGKGDRYHIHHPYNRLLNSGALSQRQVQLWVANRFYYQINIPLKDGALLSNCPDPALRREWIQRILDHDGRDAEAGGIEAWLRLATATGLSREETLSLQHVLPGVRFAVDAYVEFVRRMPWQEAVCASLTELFAPHIHQQRLNHWPDHYPWIDTEGLGYFRKRLSEARRDVEHGLALTLQYFDTRPLQERALDILQFKLDVLWSMLDAMAYNHLDPQQLLEVAHARDNNAV